MMQARAKWVTHSGNFNIDAWKLNPNSLKNKLTELAPESAFRDIDLLSVPVEWVSLKNYNAENFFQKSFLFTCIWGMCPKRQFLLVSEYLCTEQ